ncbi:MAG: hypothetical protein SO082_05700 [Candidatus Limisoma sp.]|nr:hypothetical protein [Candidatus Limisoma sp.]
MKRILLILTALLTTLVGYAASVKIGDYEFTEAGEIKIDGINNFHFGEPHVHWDGINTLTLENVQILDTNMPIVIDSDDGNACVKINGFNKVPSLCSTKDLEITSIDPDYRGYLIINNQDEWGSESGIKTTGNLTLKSIFVDIKTKQRAIYNTKESLGASLWMEAAVLDIKTGEYTKPIVNFRYLSPSVATITYPTNANWYEKEGVVDHLRFPIYGRTIIRCYGDEMPDITIAGTKVDMYNIDDLTRINGVTADEANIKMKSDLRKYAPIMNLTNITIDAPETEGIVVNEDIQIILQGVNNINSAGDGILFKKYNGSNICSGGMIATLNTTSIRLEEAPFTNKYALLLNNLILNCDWGINGSGNEDILLRNVDARLRGRFNAQPALGGLKSVTLEGVLVSSPIGAAFDPTLKGFCLNGELITDEIVLDNAVGYGFKVNGALVNSKNAADLTTIAGVSGEKVSYDVETNTLYMTNAVINAEAYDATGIEIPETMETDFNIVVSGNNTIYGSNGAITSNTKVNVSGNSTADVVTIRGDHAPAMAIFNGGSISKCKADVIGRYAFLGDIDWTFPLTIDLAEVTATADGINCPIMKFSDLVLNGVSITSPAGAAYNKSIGSVAIDGTAVTNPIVIGISDFKSLKIFGTEITANNYTDLRDTKGNVLGTVNYNPVTHTLYLKNATIAPRGILISTVKAIELVNDELSDLKIVYDGDCTIQSNGPALECSMASRSLNITIEGGENPGVLTFTSTADVGMKVPARLTFNNANVVVKGATSALTMERFLMRHALFLNKSSVKFTGDGTSQTIAGCSTVDLTRSILASPENAEFNEDLGTYAIDGTAVTAPLVFNKLNYGLKICGVEVTDENCDDLSVIDGVTGSVRYSPKFNSLVLENATISTGDAMMYAIDYNSPNNDSFYIRVHGTCNVLSRQICIGYGGKGDYSSYIYIGSDATLNLGAPETTSGNTIAAIYESAPKRISIVGSYGTSSKLNITTKGRGIWGEFDENKDLYISSIIANINSENHCVSGFGDMYIKGGYVKTPWKAQYDKSLNGIALNGALVKGNLVISPFDQPGLYINGVLMPSTTADGNPVDVATIVPKMQNVTWQPEMQVLTFDNSQIDISDKSAMADIIVPYKIGGNGLFIATKGDNYFNSGSDEIRFFSSVGSATNITGNEGSTLKVDNYYGLTIENSDLIIRNANIETTEKIIGSIGSYSNLRIENSTVAAKNIYNLKYLELVDCKIAKPSDATIILKDNLYHIGYNETSPIAYLVRIVPDQGAVETLDADVAKTITGIYDLMGRRVQNVGQGVFIIKYSDGTSQKVISTKNMR